MCPGSRKRREPDWSRLYEAVEAQAGHFTSAQALELGFTKPLISYHSSAGTFRRVGHGLYRLVRFPRTEMEELVVLWLWSKRQGVFSHETALHLHQLSDVLPAHAHMTLPVAWSRRRIKVPPVLRLHFADLPESDLAWSGPVPVTAPARTIGDCIEAHVSPDLVEQAIAQARHRGLLLRDELRRLERLAGVEQGVPR
jgi:predicted transcriptional regulator of viral defense system